MLLGQRRRQLARALVGRDDGDDQLVEGLRLLAQRGGKGLALLDLRDDAVQRSAHAGLAFLLAQRVQRFEQRDAGVQQHREFLAE
jgi:hypothetical protein